MLPATSIDNVWLNVLHRGETMINKWVSHVPHTQNTHISGGERESSYILVKLSSRGPFSILTVRFIRALALHYPILFIFFISTACY